MFEKHIINGPCERPLNIKYQGDDILISVKLKTKSGTYVDLDSYADIIVYAYTDKNGVIAMGSKTTKTGYSSLNKISSTEYQFVIDSSKTTTMTSGVMSLELNFVASTTIDDMADGRYNSIAISDKLLYLEESKIKVES